ncbi:MAG TPA: HEAT repeat domain-containing protein, partial [Vicinamibacterales bacterium]
MSPVTVFFRTLVRASAIFLGGAAMFLHPPLEWRAASHGVVGAQQGTTEAAVDGLIALLKDTDAGVRRQAASSLAELGNTRAVPALAAAIKDADPDVRAHIVSALGEFADSRATGALAEALKDESVGVRERAASALG